MAELTPDKIDALQRIADRRAVEIERLRAENRALRKVLTDALALDMSEYIQAEHQVQDAWKHDVRRALGPPDFCPTPKACLQECAATSGKPQPHRYQPDAMKQGDCIICGDVEQAEIHK
jgi:hypothetical protein